MKLLLSTLPEGARELIASQEAEIARLRAENERLFEECQSSSLSGAAIVAIRELLNAHNVPQAAFIDDHVGNAIAQRNAAEAQAAACVGALKRTLVHLVAAHSLLKDGGKSAAISDKGFAVMLADYKRSIDFGRETLATLPARAKGMAEVVEEQANDPGLWFVAKTAPEAYLQQALRRLHEIIEGRSQKECALAALNEVKP